MSLKCQISNVNFIKYKSKRFQEDTIRQWFLSFLKLQNNYKKIFVLVASSRNIDEEPLL